MGGSGDDMGVREGRGMRAARHEPGEMGDIDEEIGADLIADRAEALEIPVTGIGRAAGDDQLGLVLPREPGDMLHVNALGLAIDGVGHRLEPAAGHVDGRAVGEMAAGGQIEPHEDVARLQQREKHALIGLAAGIGLHIGEAAAEQFGRAVDGELLGDIDKLAPAVIAPAGIALGIFVGQHRALRFEHGARDDVLGGDQLDVVALATEFQLDRLRDFRVRGGKRRGEEGVGADLAGG